VDPAGPGHQPSSPKLDSKLVAADLAVLRIFGQSLASGCLWKCAVTSTPGRPSWRRRRTHRHMGGLAPFVGVADPDPVAPSAAHSLDVDHLFITLCLRRTAYEAAMTRRSAVFPLQCVSR